MTAPAMSLDSGETDSGRVSGVARRIWLCADDYGISPSVNAAIRNLIARFVKAKRELSEEARKSLQELSTCG